MKIIFRVMALLMAVGIASIAEAKTSKYELLNISSFNEGVSYPRLDFNRATSAVLVTSVTPPNPQASIVSLVITFPDIGKLTATNFQLMPNGAYRAFVTNAWIYREIIVDVNNFNRDTPVMIDAYVSERNSFVSPLQDTQLPGGLGVPLFRVNGMPSDVTVANVADQEVLTMANKKLTLSLRDRLVFQLLPQNVVDGFAIDAVWFGKGAKTLSIRAPMPHDLFDLIDPIGLVIEGNPNDPMISVKFKDPSGYENRSPLLRLRDLLDQAYGPMQWPAI